MSKENQIKREYIISIEALNWGDDFSKTVKKAIKANKKLHRSIIKLQIQALKFKLKRV